MRVMDDVEFAARLFQAALHGLGHTHDAPPSPAECPGAMGLRQSMGMSLGSTAPVVGPAQAPLSLSPGLDSRLGAKRGRRPSTRLQEGVTNSRSTPVSMTIHPSVALILLGIAFMLAETFLPTFGLIGFGGLVTFVVGLLILIDSQWPGYAIPLPWIILLAISAALLLVALIAAAVKARQRQVVSGDAGLEGSLTCITALQTGDVHHGRVYGGWVQLQGENWQVLSPTPLQPGQRVRVIARKGLLLEVQAADDPPRRGV
ncbi:hypothetical protein HX881_07600 [Pseudomonas gingeri]|nr:hypothetical protein [Pseudomonas gingeri]